MGLKVLGSREEKLVEDSLYATMVCSQLTHTPLKLISTPPSLSLYLDAAIVGELQRENIQRLSVTVLVL